MRRWICLAAFMLLALVPGLGRAAELTDFTVKDEGKKLRLDFTFSAAVKAEVIAHYANNFVALSVPGLRFSKSQLRADIKPRGEAQTAVFKYVHYQAGKDGEDAAQIRIYLSKPVTPADALVVPYDTHIEIEILKPPGSGGVAPEESELSGEPPVQPHNGGSAGGADAESGGLPSERIVPRPEDGDSADPGSSENGGADIEAGFIPDHRDETMEDGAASESEAAADGSSGEAAENGAAEAEAAAAEDENGTGGDTPLGRLPGLGGGTPRDSEAETGSAAEPEVEAADESEAEGSGLGGRPYTSFDLNQVAVQQVEIRAVPFNEAIMQLVAGTGFNVVVDDDVSREAVTLNFTQKQLSLKSALDLLCIAYDLEYSVEPDAIVVKAKPLQ